MGFRAPIVVVLVAGTAHAQSKSPWSEGVTDEQKAKAKVLLDAGNAKFVEHDYGAALDQYTAAVAVWDHPAIRFNMVRCFVQLGRNLEAAENLDKALQYGAAPLEAAIYIPIRNLHVLPDRIDVLLDKYRVRTLIRTRPLVCRQTEVCDDGVDNDCDGKLDRLDPDCP